MKTVSTLPLLATLAVAMPTVNEDRLPLADMSRRSLGSFSRFESISNKLRVRDLGDTTQNDVMNGVCKPVTVLFARGTTEAGNMGSVAGPPFVQAIGDMVGEDSVAVQGIEYPADVAGFLAGGDADGSQLMAQLVGQVMADCPDTNLVMAGYSQGGQLVHNAADMLSADETAFVQSAVIFGDPNNGDAVGDVAADNTMVICHNGDLICEGQSVILAPHLTYGIDANDAAAFVAGNVGGAAA